MISGTTGRTSLERFLDPTVVEGSDVSFGLISEAPLLLLLPLPSTEEVVEEEEGAVEIAVTLLLRLTTVVGSSIVESINIVRGVDETMIKLQFDKVSKK